MFDTPIDREIQEGLKNQSKVISIVIRNAVYTSLYSMQYCNDSVRAKKFINSQMEMIPWYWEEPELIGGVGE